MANNTKITALFLLISFVLSSCAALMNNEFEVLDGTTWKLVSYDSQPLIPGSEMTLEFSQNEVRGNASCNHYFGGFKIRGEQISISGLGWTEMACMDPPGVMEQEQILMGLLSKAAQITSQGNSLQITTTSGEDLMFERLFLEK